HQPVRTRPAHDQDPGRVVRGRQGRARPAQRQQAASTRLTALVPPDRIEPVPIPWHGVPQRVPEMPRTMKITRAESFMLKVPMQRAIGDGMQSVSVLEFVGVQVSTDENITGTGYTITVGAGGSVIKEALDSLFLGELPGKDPFNVKEIWKQLYYGKSHWIGRAGATTMAQSAIDIALWDIIARRSQRPLWQVLGGCRSADVPIYNTAAGWLNRTEKELQEEMQALLKQGYTALKM